MQNHFGRARETKPRQPRCFDAPVSRYHPIDSALSHGERELRRKSAKRWCEAGGNRQGTEYYPTRGVTATDNRLVLARCHVFSGFFFFYHSYSRARVFRSRGAYNCAPRVTLIHNLGVTASARREQWGDGLPRRGGKLWESRFPPRS